MKAAALVANKKFELFEIDIPKPRNDEVLVKVEACGVCSSELHVWLDQRVQISEPRFMGHEVSGIVEEAGSSVGAFKKGDRVVVYPYKGKGFAEFISLPEQFVMPLADHIPFHWALGEPIGCAMNATKRSGIEVGDTVVIIGAGFMGSLILQGAKLKGASRIVAIDTRDEVLAVAKQLGADVTINVSNENAVERVMELTELQGADVVIEATGFQQPLDLATEIIKIRGRLLIYGYHQGDKRLIDMKTWNWKGLDVVNAHERDPLVYMKGIQTGIKLLESGLLQMEPLVTHSFPLEQVNEGFRATHEKPQGFMKAYIRP